MKNNPYDFWDSPPIYKLYKVIEQNPNLSIDELAVLDKRSQPVTSMKISILRNEKAIVEDKDWKTKRICINPDLLKKVFKIDYPSNKNLLNKARSFRELLELKQNKNVHKKYEINGNIELPKNFEQIMSKALASMIIEYQKEKKEK